MHAAPSRPGWRRWTCVTCLPRQPHSSCVAGAAGCPLAQVLAPQALAARRSALPGCYCCRGPKPGVGRPAACRLRLPQSARGRRRCLGARPQAGAWASRLPGWRCCCFGCWTAALRRTTWAALPGRRQRPAVTAAPAARLAAAAAAAPAAQAGTAAPTCAAATAAGLATAALRSAAPVAAAAAAPAQQGTLAPSSAAGRAAWAGVQAAGAARVPAAVAPEAQEHLPGCYCCCASALQAAPPWPRPGHALLARPLLALLLPARLFPARLLLARLRPARLLAQTWPATPPLPLAVQGAGAAAAHAHHSCQWLACWPLRCWAAQPAPAPAAQPQAQA